jgi:hypothetical protein
MIAQKKCVVCCKPIGKTNWDKVKRLYSDMLEQVDMYGEDSLTENKQVLYHNKVQVECFDQLS